MTLTYSHPVCNPGTQHRTLHHESMDDMAIDNWYCNLQSC